MEAKRLFNKLYLMTIISSVFCLLFGLIGLFATGIALDTASVVAGVALIVVGLYVVFRYFDDGALRYLFGYSLLYGLLDIVAGIIMISKPDIMKIVIAVFVAFNLLIEFITKFQAAMLLRRYEVSGWFSEILFALVLMVCSIIILINPITGGETITQVVSIIIIVSALINIVDCFIIKSKVKSLKKSLKDLFD